MGGGVVQGERLYESCYVASGCLCLFSATVEGGCDGWMGAGGGGGGELHFHPGVWVGVMGLKGRGKATSPPGGGGSKAARKRQYDGGWGWEGETVAFVPQQQ